MSEATLNNFGNIFSLEGKVAVITGGSTGLGLWAASGMLQSGASKVYINARRPEKCEEACKQLNALSNLRAGAKAIPLPGDVSTLDGIKKLVAQVSESTDHIDILLPNAGVAESAAFDEFTEESWSRQFDLNTKAVFFTVQQFTPLLTKKGTLEDPSRVIITASVAGLGFPPGPPLNWAYSSSKAAVITITKQLALELAPRGVLANAIAPGFFATELAAHIIDAQGGKEKVAQHYPNKRLGVPEDFAAAVVYLASRAGSHVNGVVLPLDGGRVVGQMRTVQQ